MLNPSLPGGLHVAIRRLAALATPAIRAATRVRLAVIARDIATRDHIADVSRRLRRSIASRPQQLTTDRLTALATMARISGDRELVAAAVIAPWSTAAMARCVAAQARLDEHVACSRLVQALEIEERVEYQPWSNTAVAEVV